jgi:glutamyl-tRNA synthetase
MSQYQLTLATRASQPYLLPVLLVATSLNEARPSPVISITYEDTALLREGDKAVVQYTGASGSPVFGLINAIQELRKDFPFLNSKDEKLVSGQTDR